MVTVSLTITSVNDAPVAVLGPDQWYPEGAHFFFRGLASYDVDGDPLTYFWDFGDGGTDVGPEPAHNSVDQGTYTVTLTVSDGFTSSSDTLTMTVWSTPPLTLLSGPESGVRGQERVFSLATYDPAPADHLAGFTYSIDWGDGKVEAAFGPGGPEELLVGHVFSAAGTYQLKVIATDKDGHVGNIADWTITISAIEMQDGVLAVGGTLANDDIGLKVADKQGGVTVTLNGVVEGTFHPSGQIHVFGQAGGDIIKLTSTKFSGKTYYIQQSALVLGGEGNDTIDARGSNAANILVGGSGTDTIWGGLGPDILIGGAGIDTVRGGQGEDVLIGNATVHDANVSALLALLTEWSRTDADYATRAGHLQGAPGGHNGATVLDSSTILDDGAIDQLYGEGNVDLFFVTDLGASKDKINDLVAGEWKIAV